MTLIGLLISAFARDLDRQRDAHAGAATSEGRRERGAGCAEDSTSHVHTDSPGGSDQLRRYTVRPTEPGPVTKLRLDLDPIREPPRMSGAGSTFWRNAAHRDRRRLMSHGVRRPVRPPRWPRGRRYPPPPGRLRAAEAQARRRLVGRRRRAVVVWRSLGGFLSARAPGRVPPRPTSTRPAPRATRPSTTRASPPARPRARQAGTDGRRAGRQGGGREGRLREGQGPGRGRGHRERREGGARRPDGLGHERPLHHPRRRRARPTRSRT